MKRAFIDMTLEELSARVLLRDGLEISGVEMLWEFNQRVRIHLRGDTLPEYADCEDGEKAKNVHTEEITR